MKTILTLLLLTILSLPSLALTADRDEVQRVAENWVELVIARDGAWGRHESTRAGGIREFRRGDRILGYYCPVEPEGYILLGMHRELEPVRYYSGSGSLDPESDEGMADLLKVRLERAYLGVEALLGEALRPESRFANLLEESFEGFWATLGDPGFDAGPFRRPREPRATGMDYVEGDSLLTVSWYQSPPYNHLVDDIGCDWGIPPGHQWYNENGYVGCVATGAAMVLKYWNWPPYGESTGIYSDPYDWKNMGYRYGWLPNIGPDGEMCVYRNGTWYVASADEILAVAEISYELAEAVYMDYGCSGSGAQFADLEPALEYNYWIHDCELKHADDYTSYAWWELLKGEFENNRPVLYDIPGHTFALDGWRETDLGGGNVLREFHAIYGHNGANDGWHVFGYLPGGDLSEERCVRHVAPETIIEANLLSAYGFYPLFPYRYFGYDTEGLASEFLAGNRLQVLRSGFHLKNLVGGGGIRFYGEPDLETYFFLYGNEEDERRIRIYDGELKLVNGGELVIH